MNVWGEKLKISVFGESHSEEIGVKINGFPKNFRLDTEKISEQMKRRAPGKNAFSSSRRETDEFEIKSGLFGSVTDGGELCAVIKNKDVKKSDYNTNILRPSHADLAAYLKYGKSGVKTGGGVFSGRMTALLTFAGAAARQVLEKQGIKFAAHIFNIGGVYDTSFDVLNVSEEDIKKLSVSDFPVIDENAGVKMKAEIEKFKSENNSVGGSVECLISGILKGVGEPIFNSFESRLSALMFSIPAVKGIEFGLGFNFCEADGVSAADEIYIEGDRFFTYSNNNGGINGGITNGMPIVFRLAVKPTPTISRPLRSVDIEKMENVTIKSEGRHDPCIVPRLACVAENAAALVVLDMLLCEGEIV